jgi:Mrp family chromosome partitioning ATPase
MRMDITWKTAILALTGLVAIATVGMKPSAASKGGARSAAVGLVDCNIHDHSLRASLRVLAIPLETCSSSISINSHRYESPIG